MKILIAEDDFICQLLMKEYLQDLGTVEVASTGLAALEAATTALGAGAPYDLVCLDVMMPGMDGQQVLRAIREAEITIAAGGGHRSKIVMTTALADSQVIVQAFQSQCDGYLVKPFDRANVLATLVQVGIELPAAGGAR